MVIWLQAVALVSLLAGSFFFAMAETALVSANRLQVRAKAEEGEHRALTLERLLEDPERLVTTVLVGNNIVNIVAASLATVMAIAAWGPRGAIIAPVFMTIVVLVFGEITPKTLAVKRSTGIALAVAPLVSRLEALLRPISYVLGGLAAGVLRLFGVRARGPAPMVTQKEIEMMVRQGLEEGEVEHFEHRVIREVFEFTETPLREVMTPRAKVHRLPKNALLQEALEMAGRTGHSRLPVIDGDFDHVLGFVHAKDLLRFSDKELRSRYVGEVLRPVLRSNGNTRSDHALARMQRDRKLMCVVVDDGRSVGIATVEDLLEELVGEIHDEFDGMPG